LGGSSINVDSPSQRYDRQFWDAPLGEGILEIGRANQDSKEDNAGDIGLVCMRWCYYELNLFGDPAQRLKFKRPIELTITNDVNDGNCITPYREITYTICYEPGIGYDTNNYDGMSVAITDYLPSEVNYVSSEPYGVYDKNSHTITWNTNLPSDARGCVKAVVMVKPSVTPGSIITNNCILRGSYFDSNDSESIPVCALCPIYVDANANGWNDGYSWKDAFNHLQDALGAARIYGCNEIRVAQGIYRPDSSSAQPNGTGDRQATFQLTNGIAIKGGYAGFGTPNPNARDVRTYETILSGDIGTLGFNGDNSYRVVTGSGTNKSAILDGFTISSGNANGNGGGMYNNAGSPTVTNCMFIENLAAGSGGGIYNGFHSNPSVTNCIFNGNLAFDYGGGMYNGNYSSPLVTNCTFSQNYVNIYGGGMCNDHHCYPTITNCTFAANTAENDGGGIANYESTPTITNCILWGNFPDQIFGDPPIINYSDIQGGYPEGDGNIDADPVFLLNPDPYSGDYGDLHLQAGSPCIDVGDNDSVPPDITDLDGDGDTSEQVPFDLEGIPRIIDGDRDGLAIVDMGAFEYVQRYVVSATSGAGGSIEPAGTITVISDSNILFRAVSNTGYEVNTWYVDSSPVLTGSHTYTLTNITANHSVYVTFSRLSYTISALADANGIISPSGEIVVYCDDNMVFAAAGNRGYGIDKWYLDGNSVQTGGSAYTLTNITANHTVYVTFSVLPQYTVSASADANGSIEPAGTIVVYQGDDMNFTATGNLGYGVDKWYLDGNNVQTGGSTYTLTNITANLAIYVTFFSLPQYTVTASAGANGGIEPEGAIVLYQGDNIVFTATANLGYMVDKWYVDGNVVQTGGNTYTINNVTIDYTVSVTFSRLPYTITASAGANGSIEPSGATVVYYGDNIVFTAAANPGYMVDKWYMNGNVVQTGGNTCTLSNITADYTVYVTFSRLPYTISASAGANGNVEPSGATIVYYGDNIAFTATANPGYMVDKWYLDGNSVQGGNTNYTLYNVRADHNVLVTFAAVPLAVYVDANSPSDPGTGTRDDPFRRLQDGINAAQSRGLEVWVVAGTYKPTTGTDRTISFVMRQGVAIYGGFTGTETKHNQRNWFANPTILSGDIGVQGDTSDNSYHVVTGANNSVLDGFIITWGSANGGTDSQKRGGGMYNVGTSPTISNCSFRGNWANNVGGGMYNQSGSPRVTNCTFIGNSADNYGGGIYNYSSNVTVTDCTFSSNESYYYTGGGIYNYNSNATVTNCILWEDFYPEIDFVGTPPSVSYCDIEDGWEGAGNIDADPFFLRNPDPYSGDYGDLRLQAGSPCIDTGNNSAVPADTMDLDGDGDTTEPIPFDLEGIRRIADGDRDGQAIVDMGAFEYNDRVEMPTFKPDGGGYRTDLQVVISCATAGATIHYTTNGREPTQDDPNIESGGSVLIVVEPATTLKARAFKYDWITSDVKTAVYYLSFIRYVSISGSDDNDGLSWATAKRTLQAAVNAAQAGDEIWVAAGTYLPTDGTDRTISFVLKEDVAIYGGFVGIETSRDQRDWDANPTILSGDIGVQGNNSDNSYHVVMGANNATLDGFTITGGNANGGEPYGGGMRNNNGNPKITNCTFSGNTASTDGGGMYNENYASPAIFNCIFIGNSAGGYGGAMDNCWRGNPTVTNCEFIGNSANNGGGMVNTFYSDSVVVTGCVFSSNSAVNDGGGMYNYGGSGVFGATVTNCIFTENSAVRGGGMFSGMYNAVTVTNCTFSGNFANSGGGIYTTFSSSPKVTNCILWGNTASNGPQIYNDSSSPVITYSDVQDGWAGTGNINADPLFIGPGNLRLQPNSPCIDAGNNSAVPADIADIDGDGDTTEQIPFDLGGFPRFIDDLSTADTGNGMPPIVDMGAYEFLRSDIDQNGIVNCLDFAVFAQQWLQTDCGECGGADLTGDGQVNWADLFELVKWWLAGTVR
jgi:hypothetical protein